MPFVGNKMYMSIRNNTNFSANPINPINKSVLQTKTINTNLLSPMIGRIHKISPGCGSCGRSKM